MTPAYPPRTGVVAGAPVGGSAGHGVLPGGPAAARLDAFAFAVAHDLRAPLRAIEGYAQALVEDFGDHLPAAAHDFVAAIRQATSTMDARVEGLQRLSQLGSDGLRLVACDLAPVVRQVFEHLRRAEPGRRVVTVVPESLPVVGDGALLGIAIENLVGNAWKFTRPRPDARIDVTIDVTHDHVVIHVADNGVGFDMGQVHRLCLPFQRLHATQAFEGTGLGLASTRRIVERHGGRLWADGAPGQGATFHLLLPSVHVR